MSSHTFYTIRNNYGTYVSDIRYFRSLDSARQRLLLEGFSEIIAPWDKSIFHKRVDGRYTESVIENVKVHSSYDNLDGLNTLYLLYQRHNGRKYVENVFKSVEDAEEFLTDKGFVLQAQNQVFGDAPPFWVHAADRSYFTGTVVDIRAIRVVG